MFGKKALSFGMALFLVSGVIVANTLILRARSAGNSGILGGPAAFGDPIDSPEEATLTGVAEAAGVLPTSEAEPALASLAPASLAASESIGSDTRSEGALIAAAENAAEGVSSEPSKSLPRLPHYFIQPTSGLNWGILHAHNAVDIANVCGTPVAAAADGIVVAADQGGWNGGYGSYITIEHPNSTRTKYAHLQKVDVATGDEVRQGQVIGEIGNTGYVHGVTGCHLHFEVYGAANPFAKK